MKQAAWVTTKGQKWSDTDDADIEEAEEEQDSQFCEDADLLGLVSEDEASPQQQQPQPQLSPSASNPFAGITHVKPSALAELTANLQKQIDANKQQSIAMEAEVTKVIHNVGDLARQIASIESKMTDGLKAIHDLIALQNDDRDRDVLGERFAHTSEKVPTPLSLPRGAAELSGTV